MYCSCWFVQAQWESEVGKQRLFSLSLTTTQGVDRVGWTFIHDVKDNKKDEIGGFSTKGCCGKQVVSREFPRCHTWVSMMNGADDNVPLY